MESKQIGLRGCSVNTMMHYLKSLGIFKILSEQKYSDICSAWENSDFFLHIESQQDESDLKNEIVEFFCNKYSPTPMIVPWNKSGGFFADGKNKTPYKELKKMEDSKDPRLERYRNTINETKNILKMLKHSGKRIANDDGEIIPEENKQTKKTIKYTILKECRNHLPDDVIVYLDALYMLTSIEPIYNKLLGSGGNDGRLEFIINFMQNLNNVFDDPKQSREWIRGSLFNEKCTLIKSPIGQFYPGCMFGPNMTNTDIDGTSLINPWDYILMMEGIMIFAGGVAKRIRSTRDKASFPFNMDMTNAGYHTASIDGEKTRGEIWVPTWQNPANLGEIQHMFKEGRARFGTKQAQNGSEFARAVMGLGTERGVQAFYRFGILERNGQANIMIPLGKIMVRGSKEAEEVKVLADLDEWLAQISRIPNMPKKLESNLKKLKDNIFEYTANGGGNMALQKILITVGHLEMNLSISKPEHNRPVCLSTQWIPTCYDGSPEFRLAAALASINSVYPIRMNIEAVDRDAKKWEKGGTSIISKKPDAVQYIAAILHRRCIDAVKYSEKYVPINGSIYAPLPDVIDFLYGNLDSEKILELFIPLSFIKHIDVYDTSWKNERNVWEGKKGIPYSFAILKMALLPYKYKKPILFEPSLSALLYAKRIDEAFVIAQKRLFYSDFNPLLRRSTIQKTGMQSNMQRHVGAALLFPIQTNDVAILEQTCLEEI